VIIKKIKGEVMMLSCDEMKKRFVGKLINNSTFYKVFVINGSGNDCVYYFDKDEDLEYFEDVYLEDGPRYYDYGQDYENKREDEVTEIYYEQLP
jgi:hypothetical protein